MGLDIFFRVGKGNSYEELYASRCKSVRNGIKRAIVGGVKKIGETSSDGQYATDVEKLIKKLAVKYYGYDWGFDRVVEKFKETNPTLDRLEGFLKENLENRAFPREDVYFRKANFIYAYFSPYLKDEECEVTMEHLENLISRCDEVLADHSLASSLLPTQAGFFFGSTDYTDWYFNDVCDCRRQMKKLYRTMVKHPDYKCFVSMSW